MFLKEFTEKKNESAYNSVLNNIKMAESFCIKLKFVVAIFTSLIHNPLGAINLVAHRKYLPMFRFLIFDFVAIL